MAYTFDRPHFTVSVNSGFISDWQWCVHAVVEHRRSGLVRARKAIEVEAQLELMIGISTECRSGRDRGARSVIVLVEGDREIAGFFRGLHQAYGAPRISPSAHSPGRDARPCAPDRGASRPSSCA